jgi:ABC-2 type transport system ATP-binding protein/ribosome-dependent ATPase
VSAALDRVSKRFGQVSAVDDVSFRVAPGEIVGLLGANGAGKTTAIRILLGLIQPTAGTAELFGAQPGRETVRRVGYVPQGLGLYTDLTARENMTFQAGVYGFDPGEPPVDLARWWDVTVERMPLGVRRRVAFEVARGHRPELLVLDEPTSGVGPLGRARLWDTIHTTAEQGVGVLVTTHYLEEAEQCDRLVMLAAGRVVASGSLEDVVAGGTAVAVAVDDWRRAAAVLERAGEAVTVVAGGVRIPGGERARTERLLAEAAVAATVAEVPATLDETFVRLSR